MNDLFNQHDWSAFNKQIAIIGNPNEFLIKSMTESFTTQRFKVHLQKAMVDEISKIPSDVMLYIIVVDIVADIIPVLIYLKDVVFERQICPCLICENNEIPEITKYLPQGNIAKLFTRPVNTKEIVAELNHLYDPSSSQRNKKAILVVDDDPEYLRYIQQILRALYKVYIANSGASALMLLSKHRVDLILLDYQMPVLDGLKTMEALKSEPATAEIPVMFLTGKQDIGSVAQAVQLKPEKYLLKSTSAYNLQQTLAEFFTKQQTVAILKQQGQFNINIPDSLWETATIKATNSQL